MKEVIASCRTSLWGRRRVVRIKEFINQEKFSTVISRECAYRIDFSLPLFSLRMVLPWAKRYPAMDQERQVYVEKKVEANGAETVRYRVVGSFYVILDLVLPDDEYW